MKFEFTSNLPTKISADTLVVFVFAGSSKKGQKYSPSSNFSLMDEYMKGQLAETAELEEFTGKRGEMLRVIPVNKEVLAASRIVIVGLGEKDAFIADDLRRAMGTFAQRMRKKIDSAVILLLREGEVGLDMQEGAQMIAEGLLLGEYEFGKYKTPEKGERDFATTILVVQDQTAEEVMKKGVKKAQLFSEATILARDLVNEQPAVATPTYLAKLAEDIAQAHPEITCRVYDKEELEKMGMHAFLGIARAADTPPKFIHLEYTPKGKKAKEKLALIGKGITFDSGGINVKPGDHMQEMKMDMSGAAIVLGVFSVIAKLKPEMTVMGLIAATPNLISGKSIVPGDVVKALNGKTIEVLNTDAEGRVTMADSLSYGVKEGATKLIDFATLTGACVVALGPDISGLFANNRDLAEEIKTAAYAAGEKVWELPLEKEYKQMNKSEVADIANIPNTRYGGALAAALFLEEFVDNKPWAHLDIAGPAFSSRATDLSPKGGTGHGVRTVLNLLS